MDITPQRNLLGLTEEIWQNLPWKSRCFYQVEYAPYSKAPFRKLSHYDLPKGPVKRGAEILIDTGAYQKELAERLMRKVAKRRAKFLKTNTKGGVIIDLTHVPIANPYFLAKNMGSLFKQKDKNVFDGVLLIFDDIYASGKPKFIVVPNPSSSTPFSPADFGTSVMKGIPFATHVYTMPLVVHHDKAGSYSHFERDKNGMHILNEKEITRSLAADNIIEFQGFIDKPSKLKYVEFSDDKGKRMRIPF